MKDSEPVITNMPRIGDPTDTRWADKTFAPDTYAYIIGKLQGMLTKARTELDSLRSESVTLMTDKRPNEVDVLRDQLEAVHNRNIALEFDIQRYRIVFSANKLISMLAYKRVVVMHNWKGEHKRRMDFAPTHIEWIGDAPTIVGTNLLTSRTHAFSADQIDSWTAIL